MPLSPDEGGIQEGTGGDAIDTSIQRVCSRVMYDEEYNHLSALTVVSMQQGERVYIHAHKNCLYRPAV